MFESAYKNLNSAQKKAVDTIDGPVMVVAGPGTGKTTLLTLRIANILQKTDVQPENILALTFTNSGVRAMRTKLLDYIGDTAYRVNIFTFHSFAEHVMKEFSFYFPQFEHAQVITELQHVHILEDIIKQHSFETLVSPYNEFASITSISRAIHSIKQEGLSPDEFLARIPGWKNDMMSDESMYYKRKTGKYNVGDVKPAEAEKVEARVKKAQEIATVYESYQQVIADRGLYDFSDMILSVLRELEKNENLKLDLQEQYQYILVDEHQDTNEGQNKLIEYLTDAEHLNRRPNLCTVGDEKQSIYRFQGASQETFDHLTTLYDDIEHINLTENYRSTQTILDGAHSVITHSLPESQSLTAHQKGDDPVTILDFSQYKSELLYVAKDIQKKLQAGTNPNEIAVMYRSNKHIREIKDVFTAFSIPFSIISKDDILADPHIRHFIDCLKVIHNLNDSHALGKALFADFLHIPARNAVQYLHEYYKTSRSTNVTLLDVLTKSSDTTCVAVAEKIHTLTKDSHLMTFEQFFKHALDTLGYIPHVLTLPDSRDHILRLDKLFDEVKRQVSTKKHYELADFIAFIDAYDEYGITIETHEPEYIEGVRCMTAHKSKGLEFEHVYIVNTLRKNWEKNTNRPNISLPIEEYKGDIDDERRLFYVAMTRAKKTLTITSSQTDWEGVEKEKSQFISEIDSTNTDAHDTKQFEKNTIDEYAIFLQSQPTESSLFDPTYISQLFTSQPLSVTALTNYVECPVKFFLRSLVKLPSEYSINLVFGDIVHKSLQAYFDVVKNEKSVQSKTLLHEKFTEAMERSSLYGRDFDTHMKRGTELLDEYYDAYHATWPTLIDNERHIKRTYTLPNGADITLSGIIDKIEYHDSELEGKITIVDYKTGKPYSDKKLKSQKEDLRRQIIFYHILFTGYHDGAFTVDSAVLDFLEKNSKGNFEQHTVSVSAEDIAEVETLINQCADDAMNGHLIEKGCGKRDCEYCSLLSIKQ